MKSTILKPVTRVPWVSLTLAGIAVALQFLPDGAAWLEYDRAALAEGQLCRVVTCHLTHANADHLIWDAAALVVLGMLCEARHRRAFLGCLAASAVVIPASLWWALPAVETYRGLSGIDSAVFMLLAVQLFREGLTERRAWLTVASATVILGFAAKVAFELASGRTLFVDSAATGMTPVPLVHVVGGVIGALTAAQFAVELHVRPAFRSRCARMLTWLLCGCLARLHQ